MSEYNLFCIYELSIAYPVTWKIDLHPGSEQSKGSVVFESPEKTNIFVSWGPLEKMKESCPSCDEFAEDSISRVKKTKGVKKVELIQTKLMQINSHEARFTHLCVVSSRPSLIPFLKTKTSEQEIRSLHLYCGNSGRYLVIYGATSHRESLEYGSIFEDMIKSLKCHKVEGK